MQCAKCYQLVDDHARLKKNSAATKRRLREGITRRSPTLEYQTLLKTASEAWLKAHLAGTDLEQHKRIHFEAN